MAKIIYNIPNLLSLYRIAVIPAFLILFYIDGAFATWVNVTLFLFACLSDYFDGVIARRTNQTTVFGKFLDSSSDKILIGGTLMLLVAFERIDDIWIAAALIIYLREILVAGLREFLGQYNVSVPISMLGKIKAAIQMIACGFLMAGEHGNALIPHAFILGHVFLIIATVITVISGWDYLKAGLETLKKLEAEQQK